MIGKAEDGGLGRADHIARSSCPHYGGHNANKSRVLQLRPSCRSKWRRSRMASVSAIAWPANGPLAACWRRWRVSPSLYGERPVNVLRAHQRRWLWLCLLFLHGVHHDGHSYETTSTTKCSWRSAPSPIPAFRRRRYRCTTAAAIPGGQLPSGTGAFERDPD